MCNLRVLLLTIAAGLATYSVAAQLVHGVFVETDRQQYLGWGQLFLAMSMIFIVLPALVLAGATYRFRFDGVNPWLGNRGGRILITTVIISLALGTICGWPS